MAKSKRERCIFHIDVNSAYLSWEAVYRLQHGDSIDLREIPSIVGGDVKSRHGIVLAKSIPAKKYNIKTGETLFAAMQKCPDLAVIPPSYELYMKCSNAMVELLKDYSPHIQRYSIDECFLDYTTMEKHFGPPVEAANKMKDHIHKELGFTVNIGISENKLLAKMASDFSKPNKVHTLFKDEIEDKMWPLPVEDLFMVGHRTLPKLYSRGIKTIGDLANTDVSLVKYHLKSHGVMIWNYANGRENSSVISTTTIPIKGLGNSTTIAFDVEDRTTAHMIILSLVETTAMRLRASSFHTGLVCVHIKNIDFFSYSHQKKLHTVTDITNEIYKVATALFDEMWKGEPIRHLGVRLSELCNNDFFQCSIFHTNNYYKKLAMDRSIDNIRSKYGTKSVFRAGFLHSGLKPVTGGVSEEEYPMMSSIL